MPTDSSHFSSQGSYCGYTWQSQCWFLAHTYKQNPEVYVVLNVHAIIRNFIHEHTHLYYFVTAKVFIFTSEKSNFVFNFSVCVYVEIVSGLTNFVIFRS